MSHSNTTTVILPDLIGPCPFESECNSHYETVANETDQWLHSYGIPYTESTSKYSLWSALTFPQSSAARLREACDVWTLLFLADDIMDSFMDSISGGHSKRELFQNMNECLQAAGSFKPLTRFAAALHDWWQRVLLTATASCQQRLIEAYQRSNEASLRQVEDPKLRQTVPDLDTYIEFRRDTSYGRVVCSFVDYSLDLDIPDQCWQNEIFQRLIDYTTDAAAWTNDVYSFNLEHSKGDYNLITVLQQQNPSLDIQQAMNKAGKMIIQRYADFQHLRTTLPSWSEEIDAQVNQYVDALALGIIANAVWSFETPRYFGKDRKKVKRTRHIKLLVSQEMFYDALPDNQDATKGSYDEDDDLQEQASVLSSGYDTDDRESVRSQSIRSCSNDFEKYPCAMPNATETDTMEEILSPYFYLNSLSGKKVRSKLSSALNSWFKVPQEKVAIIDEVIGMLHNASLMIDDIEDGSTLRRGQPAAHILYGVPLTINSAELACFLAIQKAMELNHPLVGRIMIDNLIELHKGQGYDIYWRDNHVCPSEEDYQQMVIQKCGGLFLLIADLLRLFSPLRFDEKEIQLINELCQYLALLFQIRDDYCNLLSSEYAENKSFCEDLSEGKYSFMIIHALRTYPDDHRIEEILKQRTDNIELKREVVRLLHQFGSIRYTREKCLDLAEKSYQIIDQLDGNICLKMIINQFMCTFDAIPVEEDSSLVTRF